MRLLLLPSLVVFFVIVGCARQAARPAEQHQDIPVPIAVAPEVVANDAGVDAGGASLEEVARDAYAAIARGRFAVARARLDEYDSLGDRCSGEAHASALPGGGSIVTGPRGILVTDAAGAVVSHEVVPGCLHYGDATLRIVTTKTAVRITEKDTSVELPREEGSWPEAFDVSDAWALVIDRHAGDWIAMNRRTANVMRGHDRDARVAGEWLVVDGDKGISMRRADGRTANVRGCDGQLLAAVRLEKSEVALHVGMRPKSEDDVGTTDTRVCLVREDGSTRKAVRLGSATCGLARAMPCPYVLQGSTRRLLGFGSMRGHITIVDAAGGRTLSIPLPAGAYFDGGAPGGVWECDGDRLCISYARPPDGDVGASSLTLQGDKLVGRVLGEKDERRPEWCVRAMLPVPSAVCDVE